jgi:hypothetical protein
LLRWLLVLLALWWLLVVLLLRWLLVLLLLSHKRRVAKTTGS